MEDFVLKDFQSKTTDLKMKPLYATSTKSVISRLLKKIITVTV